MIVSLQKRPPWLTFVVAIVIFAAAVALRLVLHDLIGGRTPYVTFFPAVMLAALLGGFNAGVVVTLLSAMYVMYFLIDPVGQMSVRDAGDWLGQIVFLLSGLMVSWLSEYTHRAQKRAFDAEAQVMLGAERDKASAALKESEAKFRSYVENSPIAVFVVNREGKYLDFNAAAIQLLGYPAETLARMHLLEVHRIEDHATVLSELERLFQSGRLDAEARLLRGDGLPVWVSLHAVRLDSEHAIAYCQDITDLRATVESMRERLALQEQLATITAVVPGVLHSFRRTPDGSFCLTYASPKLFSLCGLRPDEISRDPASALALIHPEDRTMVQESLCHSARTMTPWRCEFRVNHPEKGEIWAEAHSIPNHEEDGSILWRGFMHDITERRRTEEMVHETGRRLELAVRSAGLGVWEWDVTTGAVLWNDRMFELYGMTREAFSGNFDGWRQAVHPEDLERCLAETDAVLKGEKEFDMEFRVVHPDGRVKTVKADAIVVRDQAGRPLRLVGLNRDITEQRTLEAQLLESKKMEAVGRLAGGVAHDFNNSLSVILGYADLARMVEIDSGKFHEYLDEIVKAAEHSRDVTQQLLAFSRNEIISPREVDLSQLIRRSDKTLWRLIGKEVRLNLSTPAGIWPVLMDPAQVSQIVMSLALNARDAMPGGGTLSIELANLPGDQVAKLGNSQAAPVDYVRMTVTDTGVGMDRELQERIFEPFFTTKGVGKGTGLGLATVYGIMKQNGGFVTVSSAPGQGAAFNLYFPRMRPEQASSQPQAQQGAVSRERRILLVEDEATVRLMAQLMLEKVGFSVLVAASPHEALEKCRRLEGEIDCLLTDVIMPGMSGVEMSRAIRCIRPEIGVVYMSGYSSDMIAHHGVLAEGVVFLQKPFDVKTLIEKIEQAIQFSRTP